MLFLRLQLCRLFAATGDETTARRRAVWLLMALAVLVRLPGITRPLVGNFATKNAVYAMVARNWAEGRAPLWAPTLDCLVGGERSLHLLEWPVSAAITAGCWRLCGGSLDVWGRATSIAFSAAAVWLLFQLVCRWHGRQAAIGAGAVFALSPVAVIYGQSFMLEASLVAFTLAAIWCLEKWFDALHYHWLLLVGMLLGLTLVTKIYMLVLLPVLAMLAWRRCTTYDEPSCPSTFERRQSLLLKSATALCLATLPAFAWYGFASWAARPGSPYAHRVFYSVNDSADVHRLPHPLLADPEFYSRVGDDLTGVVLTPLGFALLLLGMTHREIRRHWPWLAAIGLLILALPLKFFAMNYYYLAVLPPLCLVAGLGWQHVRCNLLKSRRTACAALLVGLLFSVRYAAKPAFVTPPEDRAVVAAAKAIREHTQAGEPIVTSHGSTIDLLYYCDRPGWAVPPQQLAAPDGLAEFRRQNARAVVIVSDDPADFARRANLKPLAKGAGYSVAAMPDARGEKRSDTESRPALARRTAGP